MVWITCEKGEGRGGRGEGGWTSSPQCAFIPDPERVSEKESKTLGVGGGGGGGGGGEFPGLCYCSASLVEIFLTVHASHYLLVLFLSAYIS